MASQIFVWMAYAFLLGAMGMLMAGFFICGFKALLELARER